MTQSYQTAQGHEQPFGIQFSLFMPNRVGQLSELLDMLHVEKIRLLGVSVVDSTDWAVVRAIFSDPNKTRELLKSRNVTYTESPVLLVELQTDETLRHVCEHLLRAELNVHFAFPLTLRQHDHPIMALHVDDSVLAAQILTRRQIVLVGNEDLADPR